MFSLQMRMELECQLCAQPIGHGLPGHSVNVALFGAGAYCTCPKCGSDTSSDKKKPKWRTKVRKWVKAKSQGRLEDYDYSE